MKQYKGKVLSVKSAKTVVVAVEVVSGHSVYKKRVKMVKKYHVHNEVEAKVGDRVIFTDSKPVSKLKKWKVVKILGEKKPSKAKDKESKDKRQVAKKKKEGKKK